MRLYQSGTTEKAEVREPSGRGSGDWAVPEAGLGDRNHGNLPPVSQSLDVGCLGKGA